MSEKTIQFTPEQKASINYRGGSLLVSAAAGSGKTKVLVERLLSRIDEGDDIDDFLVITYTRAAAFELRERIHEELLNKLADSPGNLRLRRQSMLCKGASIDTIHTFCSEILRENAHLVRLPPDFRITDESESTVIMNDAAESVLNEMYENITEYPGFPLLVDTITEGRDDKSLSDVLLDIFKKLQSTPDPDGWVKSKIEAQKLDGIKDISETDYGLYMLKSLQSTVGFCKKELEGLIEGMNAHAPFADKYSSSLTETLTGVCALYSAFDKGWNDAHHNRNISFPRPMPIRGYDELKDIRTRCIKELKSCISELEISSEEHLHDMKMLSPAITTFLKLIQKFDNYYSEEKRRRGVVDFSDLEHMTLSLLIEKDSKEKTELAHSLSSRYKEIMIDEYQDVNEVQEYIFNALSKNRDNIFMVGDMKQSIYRFRLADPLIFLSKYNRYKEYDFRINKPVEGYEGSKVHLSHNFRSRAGILSVVNHIFSNIMSSGFGEMEYTGKEWLVPGGDEKIGEKGKRGKPYLDSENNYNKNCVELDIIDFYGKKNESEEENLSIIEIEAEHIARKIESLLNKNYEIKDEKEGTRQVSCSDIVILLRSMKGRAWRYATALAQRGIPVEYPGSEGFFETIEVKTALSLLSVIDNPLPDIPLAAVLTGPIYGLTSNELAEIRACNPGLNLYDALIKSAELQIVSSETSVKCKKITSDIKEFRSMAADMPSDRFIWYVYNKTGLPGLAGSLRNGKRRRSNLIFLAESARKFEKSGYKGLFGFLTFIRNLQERGYDLTEGPDTKITGAESKDTVRIMSIHKSKGLEFPIVFLANTSKNYNFQDSRKSVVFHTDLGIGTMLTDKKRRIKYSTLARSAIQDKLNNEMLSEELRVLYVAMTRAKDKLVITAALKDATRTLEKIKALPPGKVAPQLMRSMRSMAEWILAGTREICESKVLINTISADALKRSENKFIGTIADVEAPGVKEAEKEAPDINKVISSSDRFDLMPSLLRLPETLSNFNLKYPYESSTVLPSKLTVTGLTNQADTAADSATWTREELRQVKSHTLPPFISKKLKMSAAERGILLHLVMQCIDHNMMSLEPDIADIDKQLQLLVLSNIIAEEQRCEVDKQKISRFYCSGIGSRVINAKKLYREFKFSILCPAEDYFSGGGSDEILVQGVIDCFFEDEEEIVLVDFKTDKVTDKNFKEKAKYYTPQLYAYADAIKRITGKHVKERVIYFFAIDTAYSV